jgi:hypothetical protein
MLQYRRPAFSETERKFIRKYIEPFGAKPDEFGNYILKIGDAPVLWSSHTDTVHYVHGMQQVWVDKAKQFAWTDTKKSNCLGADCTTGVYVMLRMIEAGVPGLYIFHRDEEAGGGGSSHIAKKTPELLDGIKYAIAFDRKGSNSIITHQWGGRCCSSEFAKALGEHLMMKEDSGGTFTDTANYTDIIPECTNISVGYMNQHTAGEWQDLQFAEELVKLMLTLDVASLPVARDPKAKPANWWEDDDEFGWYHGHRTLKSSKGGYRSLRTGEPLDDDQHYYGRAYGSSQTYVDDSWYDAYDLEDLVRTRPADIVNYLLRNGVNARDIMEEIGITHINSAAA